MQHWVASTYSKKYIGYSQPWLRHLHRQKERRSHASSPIVTKAEWGFGMNQQMVRRKVVPIEELNPMRTESKLSVHDVLFRVSLRFALPERIRRKRYFQSQRRMY
jgi:hypothetical protein